MTKIYVLCDELGSIRYVGRTYRGLQERLCEHLLEARKGKRSHRHHWLRSLLSKGLLPSIRLIGEVDGNGYAEEQKWIEYLRSLGVHLVNSTDGGAGPSGYRLPPDSLAKMRERLRGNKNASGHKVTPEVREILRRKSIGRTKSRQEIEKIRTSLKGRPKSAEHCRNVSLSKIGHTLGPEGRAKVSRANKGRKHTPEAIRKISEASRRQAQRKRSE